MPRSMKDSDEDAEPKTVRRTRTLSVQSVVDSPIRRSKRIKQSAKQKSSPDSESDTSSNSNQPVRTTRQRTVTMDSAITEPLKGRRVRKPSISSETSEIIDVEGTPSKRITRRSFTAATLSTPTRASTRAASKRFIRAGSETKSPPSSRTTRRTRASSVDPETMSEQSQNVSSKIRKRASVLPLQSPVKEEVEEKQQPNIKIDVTLNEVEEVISSGNDSSLDRITHSKENQKVKEMKDINKDKIEENNSSNEMILAVASNETSQQLANNEVDSKHTAILNKKSADTKVQSAEDLSSDAEIEVDDEILIDDTNTKKSITEDKSRITENEESLAEIKDSPMCQKSSTKELTIRLENILETSIGGQKKSPSNKENQTLNIINDTAEKNIGPIISNVTSLCSKSLTTVFANKSLNEIEIKSTKSEPSVGTRRRSRESTETGVKHTAMLKENTDNIEEITDSFVDSVNSTAIREEKNLDSSSIDDTTKRQSLVHDIDKKSTTTNDGVKPVSSLVTNTESVKEIIDNYVFVETVNKTDAIEMANKLNKSVANTETCDEITDSKGSSCSLTANVDNKMIEEANVSQDENKSLNESIKIVAESNLDHSNESIDVETCDDNSIDKPTAITQDEAKNDLLDSTEQTKKNLSSHITKSTLESSSTTLETINPPSNDLNADNSTIQDMQSDDIMEVSDESAENTQSKKEESMNTSPEITAISTQRGNEDTSATNIREEIAQLNQEQQEHMKDRDQEDLKNMETDDDKSYADIISTFRDIPADEWKKDASETRKTVESNDESNPVSMENESEAECDLVLVDKQAWLMAENIKAVRNKECFEYDSDDTVLLKSRKDTTKANSNKTRLSTVNEALLINIDDDEEEEEEEEKEEENEEEGEKEVKTRKSSIKRKSASEKDEDPSTVCIDVDSSSSVDKFLNKSGKDLNRSNRPTSRLSKSAAEEFAKTDDESDEIGDDADKLNVSLQTRKSASLRKSTGKQGLNKSSTNTPSRRSFQSTQSNSTSKSDNSEVELDNIETHTERNLKKKKRSLDKSKKFNEDADIDIDEVESESKKSSSSEKSDKEDKDDKDVNMEDSDENDEDLQNKDLKYKKDLNYSTLALAGSLSNKSSDDASDDSLKHYECIPSLFDVNSDTSDDDDDGTGSTDSDIKKEYNLDGAEQEYSDDNIPYDECRTSESESSDLDDTGSDLADFIVADDAIEGEKTEEQNDEDDKQEEKEDEAEEQEEIEDKDVDNEQLEDAKEESDSTQAEENEDEISAETNVSKNNVSDKSLKIGKDKKKISTEHIVTCPKKKKDIKTEKLPTKKVEQINILDTSGSASSVKKKKKKNISYVDETKQILIKHLNESEINRKKFLKAAHTLVECSTPKINSSKEEFANNVETAVTTLGALEADEKSSSMIETTQRKKKKSRKDSILKEDPNFKEPRVTINKEKLLHTSLPSDSLERIEKARPMSKTFTLNKTMNVTHTETPTIRDLRKEKLNESAPELKLRTETKQPQKERLSKEDDIVQKKTDEIDSDEEVPNLVALFQDNIQEPSQQKQKKRKKQAEETLSENIENATESDIFKQQKKKKKKKEKSDELSQLLTVEDIVSENTHQLVEKKKKKKKKKIDATKTDENAKEDIQQEDIRRKEKDTLHAVQDEALYGKKKKKKEKIVSNMKCDNPPSTPPTENIIIAKKKVKSQEIPDNKETLPRELPKKMKKKEKKHKEIMEEKKIPSLQTEVSKSKSKSAKKTEPEKLQLQNTFASKSLELRNAAFIKARNEALEAIKSATERIKLHKKLKKEKHKDNANTIEEQEVPIKRKKIEKHLQEQTPSSTGGLKRLSDDVIDKLSDMPTRVKRRKLLQNTEQVMPSLSSKNSKFIETKMKKNFTPLNSNGGTTQFTIINMSKTKKQPSKTIASIMSYRQRMLARNSREPVSSYLMYLRKQRGMQNSGKDGFSDNAF